MSTTISGFAGMNSGLPIDDIIAKLIAAERTPITLMEKRKTTINNQKAAYTDIQKKTEALLSAIKNMTKRDVLAGSSTLFGSKIGTSSDATIATATATGSAATQTINLEVKSLPTSTRASSNFGGGVTGVGKVMDANTTLSQLGITDDDKTFTVFINGTAKTITDVDSTDTVGGLLAQIQAQVPEITSATVDASGKINISYTAGNKITFGAAGGDTSTFLAKVGLLTAKDDPATNSLTASKPVTLINLNQNFTTANLANPNGLTLTNGTFSINGVTFDTTGKSINQIITEINNNADAKVTANFNVASNQLEFTAKSPGSPLISLADGTGNFLASMGLIGPNVQTSGTNAEFVLNGVTMYSNTTSVDETVTGLAGITLDLKKAQAGSTIQINIQQDTDKLTDNIQKVLDAANTLMDLIDKHTDGKSGGVLAGESRLKSLRSQIRGIFTSAVSGLNGGAYDSLQQAGISTGKPGAFTEGGVVSKTLTLDKEAFKTALATSPDIIEKLFVARDLVAGDPNDQNMDGIFTQLNNLLSDTTYKDANGKDAYGVLFKGSDTQNGLFASFMASVDARISRLDDSISRGEDRLAQREKTLRQQYLAMDKLVGQYQQQGTAITGLINQMNASSK